MTCGNCGCEVLPEDQHMVLGESDAHGNVPLTCYVAIITSNPNPLGTITAVCP